MIVVLKHKIFLLILLTFASTGVYGLIPNQTVSANQYTPTNMAANYSAPCSPENNEPLTAENCGIVAYVVLAIRVLSGLVGIVVVLMIVLGGLQYTAARDDPQAVAAAKTRIKNAVLALVFYLFAFAFLQWLVPGGVL